MKSHLPERVVVADGMYDLAHQRVFCWCGDRIEERRRDALVHMFFFFKIWQDTDLSDLAHLIDCVLKLQSN